MIIIQDFREKHGFHNEIEEYCKKNSILLYRMKLDVGDYMLGSFEDGKYKPFGNKSVDTKQDLSELANDLYKDKLQFNKKYRKCYDKKTQLYILVEEPINTLSDILRWQSKYSKLSGKMLLDLIDRVRKSYGVKFVFCDKTRTAQTIIDILTKNEKEN